jgi:hypothetical protein
MCANLRFFTTEYCCPADSLEFHGNRKKAPRQGALTDKCNRFRRTIKSTAYSNTRLPLGGRARRGGRRRYRIKIPCSANRRFDVYSVVIFFPIKRSAPW